MPFDIPDLGTPELTLIAAFTIAMMYFGSMSIVDVIKYAIDSGAAVLREQTVAINKLENEQVRQNQAVKTREADSVTAFRKIAENIEQQTRHSAQQAERQAKLVSAVNAVAVDQHETLQNVKEHRVDSAARYEQHVAVMSRLETGFNQLVENISEVSKYVMTHDGKAATRQQELLDSLEQIQRECHESREAIASYLRQHDSLQARESAETKHEPQESNEIPAQENQ